MQRHLFLAFIAAIVWCAPTAAQEGDTAPANDEPVYAAIVEMDDAPGEYSGTYCSPELPDDAICLGASVLIQKGRIVRYLAGRPAERAMLKNASGSDRFGRYTRFRFIAGHARRQVAPGQYLAVIEPTDQEYVYLQWYDRRKGGQTCFPEWVLDIYGSRLPEKLRTDCSGKAEMN